MKCVKLDTLKIATLFIILITFEILFINFPKFFDIKPIYLDIYNINYVSTQKIYSQGVKDRVIIKNNDDQYLSDFLYIFNLLNIYTKQNIQDIQNYQLITKKLLNSTKTLDIIAILVVQIHNRPQNLKALVKSLQESRNVSNSLIVFSSDCYSPEIYNIIQKVKFVPFIHISYPLTPEVLTTPFKVRVVEYVKAHPRTFGITFTRPGNLSNHNSFSRTNVLRERALGLLAKWITACESEQARAKSRLDAYCKSAEPGSKTEREPAGSEKDRGPKFSIALIKHHWWWKINSIFGTGKGAIRARIPDQKRSAGLEGTLGGGGHTYVTTYRTADFGGPVVLLEEDHYVLPDFFGVLGLAWAHLYPPPPTHLFSPPGLVPPDGSYRWKPSTDFDWTLRPLKAGRRSEASDAATTDLQRYVAANGGQFRLLSLGNYDPSLTDLSNSQASPAGSLKRQNVVGVIKAWEEAKDPFRSPEAGQVMDQELWRSAFHNMGLVLNRATWHLTFGSGSSHDGSDKNDTSGSRSSSSWVDTFCTYDDYNWDWTLNHLLRTLVPGTVFAVYPKLARVVHIGVCGVHQKVKGNEADKATTTTCSPTSIVADLRAWIVGKEADGLLFPNRLKFLEHYRYLDMGIANPNGGWRSVSNHELCFNHSRWVGGDRA